VFQSTSSLVLDSYQDLLRDHLVVTLFLTMLVGAGGNAGNQSAIKVIRGLATGSISSDWPSVLATLKQQVGARGGCGMVRAGRDNPPGGGG
jgi:Mg/Co/Ni transporter MgtE